MMNNLIKIPSLIAPVLLCRAQLGAIKDQILIRLPDEGYSRNKSGTLNGINLLLLIIFSSAFFFLFVLISYYKALFAKMCKTFVCSNII